jgi:GMP synthase (glutamine-hydrolysing)
MTRRTIVIRHVAFEDPGVFAGPLTNAGYALDQRDAGVDPLPLDALLAADLLLVMGGPIGAYDEALYPFLSDEIAAVAARAAAGRPVLGVCLGAQLIARALGARVYPGPAKEIGWSALSLTEAGRAGPLAALESAPVLHWHGDTFDLPPGAERLASTPLCLNQAFAVGSSVLALQFHPEVDPQGFERWLIGHAAEIASVPGLSVAGLRADTARLGQAAAAAGRRLMTDWLAGLPT